MEDAPPGSRAAELLARVRVELDAATVAERRQVLRKLVRRLHPDQNPGKDGA